MTPKQNIFEHHSVTSRGHGFTCRGQIWWK